MRPVRRRRGQAREPVLARFALGREMLRFDREGDPAQVIHFNQIVEGVFVGMCPAGRDDAENLKRALGVSAVLNLQTDEDFEEWGVEWPQLEQAYHELGIEVRRVPIADLDPEDLRDKLRSAVEALRELVSGGHRVYLHCTAGVERSPTVVVAYLAWSEGWSVDQAGEHVKRVRYCAPDLELIRRAGPWNDA